MIHSTQMYIPLKPLFSKHKGGGVQFTDEPTGNLDKKNSDEIVELLRRANQEYRQTIIMITHNLEIAKTADRVIVIEDGKIIREG